MVIARGARLNLAKMSDRIVSTMPWLDKPASVLHRASDPVFGANGVPAVKDALYGTWLGHPLHPLMTDIPIGCWTASLVFDVLDMEEAADLSLKIGKFGALGAAISGVAQWHDLQDMEAPRRLGTLHAMLNVTATACYGLSWILRDRDSRSAGIAFSTAGIALAACSAATSPSSSGSASAASPSTSRPRSGARQPRWATLKTANSAGSSSRARRSCC